MVVVVCVCGGGGGRAGEEINKIEHRLAEWTRGRGLTWILPVSMNIHSVLIVQYQVYCEW